MAKAEQLLIDNSPSPSSSSSGDDSDGGFSSLDGMLQWAIGHSDPAKLKEAARDVRTLSSDELEKRQIEIKELMEELKMPSDAELMRIAIGDLKYNSSLSLEDRHRALHELLILVEPIHNANDLNKLGGLFVIIDQLNHPDPDTRKLAAWVLQLGALPKLMEMVKSEVLEEANKGLYAVSALIRNNLDGQRLFHAEAGGFLLQDILSNSSTDIRLQKKAVFLVGDLAESQLENTDKDVAPFLSSRALLKSVVDLTVSSDLDLQEKALMTIKNVLQLRTTEAAAVLKEVCGLDVALERIRKQLKDLILMAEEDQKDYALDLESLRSQVEAMVHSKLGNNPQNAREL
ncbi:hypothetical protein L484_004698 [Morus notabilis]|uniref:Nucleotide exchange factor Fes1 domain-containing protein n=1 Tax=Morus notabilis TaxID=981085 RepID=W9SXV0_9ROSA|nr:hypothetical protein L484_004698 [Morus notabilis]